MGGSTAGTERMGGWLDSAGRLYPADAYEHLQVAAILRATGDGPKEPWDVADSWVCVKTSGQFLCSVRHVTQAQLDTLGDMIHAAPDSTYRTRLLDSLRELQALELAFCE